MKKKIIRIATKVRAIAKRSVLENIHVSINILSSMCERGREKEIVTSMVCSMVIYSLNYKPLPA